MANGLNREVVTAAVVGVVGGALIGGLAGFYLAQYEAERPFTTIVLAVDQATGQCKAREPLPILSKHRKRLTWHINNQCNAPQFVELRNFSEVVNGTAGPPETGIVPGDVVNRPAPFPAGVTTGGLQTDPLRNVTQLTSYKYEIWIATALPTSRSIDPDIEWWKD